MRGSYTTNFLYSSKFDDRIRNRYQEYRRDSMVAATLTEKHPYKYMANLWLIINENNNWTLRTFLYKVIKKLYLFALYRNCRYSRFLVYLQIYTHFTCFFTLITGFNRAYGNCTVNQFILFYNYNITWYQHWLLLHIYLAYVNLISKILIRHNNIM